MDASRGLLAGAAVAAVGAGLVALLIVAGVAFDLSSDGGVFVDALLAVASCCLALARAGLKGGISAIWLAVKRGLGEVDAEAVPVPGTGAKDRVVSRAGETAGVVGLEAAALARAAASFLGS